MTQDKSGEDRTARLLRLAEERSRERATETDRIMAEQDHMNSMTSMPELVRVLRQGAHHMTRMAESLDFHWDLCQSDPR